MCVCARVDAWVHGPNKVPKVSRCVDDCVGGQLLAGQPASQVASSTIREFGLVAEAL